MPATIELRLLGRFGVSLIEPAKTPIAISMRKARALTAYLALQPDGTATREVLADLLWGDRVDAQARQNLRQCLAALRRDLETVAPDFIVAGTETVTLRRELARIDAFEFERLAASAAPEDLAAAAALYSGEFLSGLEIEIEAFADWLRAQRTRLAKLAAETLRRAAEQFDDAGDGDIAIAHAERLLALDPLREDRQRLLIRLIAKHRGRDAALAQAKISADELARELGVVPEPETSALVEALRSAAAPTPHVIPAAVPAPSAIAPPRRPSLWQRPRVAALLVIGAIAATVAGLGLQGADSHVPEIPKAAAPQPKIERPTGSFQILVLPVSIAGDDAAERKRTDIFVDDLITLLSRVTGMRVAGRHLTAQHRDRPIDFAALEREPYLRYVLEASVRREGETVVANIRLVDIASRALVWSRSFVRPIADSTGPQSELLLGIGREVQLALFDAEAEYVAKTKGSNDTATLLARARALTMRHTTRADRIQIRELLEEVLRREPDNPGAILTLVSAIMDQVGEYQSSDPEKDLKRAEELLQRARIVAPRANVRHLFMGRIHRARGEHAAALAEFEQSIEINPSHASSYAHRGHTLMRLGRIQEGVESVQKAMRLSPNDPSVTFWLYYLADAEVEAGRMEAAIDLYKQSIAKRPHNGRSHLRLAATYHLVGDGQNASRHLAEFRKLVPPEQQAGIEHEYRTLFGTGQPHEFKIDAGIRQLFALPR